MRKHRPSADDCSVYWIHGPPCQYPHTRSATFMIRALPTVTLAHPSPDPAQAIFFGTIGGQPTTIKTAWSGSEGGMQTVAGSVAIAFLPNTTATSTGGTGGATVATPGNGGDVAVPDVEMSDSFQSSSAFFGLYRGVTYPTLTESPNSPVGITPFKFVASKGAPAGLTNITNQAGESALRRWSASISVLHRKSCRRNDRPSSPAAAIPTRARALTRPRKSAWAHRQASSIGNRSMPAAPL